MGTGTVVPRPPVGGQAKLCFGNRGQKSQCGWALVTQGESGRNKGQEVSRDQVTEAGVGFSSRWMEAIGVL